MKAFGERVRSTRRFLIACKGRKACKGLDVLDLSHQKPEMAITAPRTVVWWIVLGRWIHWSRSAVGGHAGSIHPLDDQSMTSCLSLARVVPVVIKPARELRSFLTINLPSHPKGF